MRQVFKRIPTLLASLLVIAAVLLVSAPGVSAATRSNRYVSIDMKAAAGVSGFNKYSDKAVISGKNGDKVSWRIKVTNKRNVPGLFLLYGVYNHTDSQRYYSPNKIILRFDHSGQTQEVDPASFWPTRDFGRGHLVTIPARKSVTITYTTITVGNKPCDYREVNYAWVSYYQSANTNPITTEPVNGIVDSAKVVGPTCVKNRNL